MSCFWGEGVFRDSRIVFIRILSVCRRASTEPSALREIFDDETSHSEVGNDVAWGSEESTMRRAARVARPLNPSTVDQLINDGQNMQFYQGIRYCSYVAYILYI